MNIGKKWLLCLLQIKRGDLKVPHKEAKDQLEFFFFIKKEKR